MSTETNKAVSQGFNMTAPSTAKVKRDDIKLLEVGPNPGILYSMVDMGTHFNKWFDKSQRTLRLTFEFPLLKQLFNEGDTEVKPTVISTEETFQIAEKSNLKKLIDGAEGRVLQPNEYKNGYNIGSLLGKTFVVTIFNKPSKKDPSIIYNNISGIQGITDHVRQSYAFPWEEVTRTNPLVGFMIDPEGNCFQTEQFAKLPKYIYDKICLSDEAQEFLRRGGKFSQYSDYKDQQSSAPTNAPVPVQRAPQKLDDSCPVIMIAKDFTYEQYLASKWTAEMLVENGKATWKPKAPVSAPAMPSGPSQPQAPQGLSDGLDVVDEDEVQF